MKSSYDVDIAAPADAVWDSLTDLDAIVTTLPGAVLERDDDSLTGSVKTRLGTIQVTYRVTARADLGVSGRHVAVVVVTGREARGSGTLAASLTVTVRSGANPGETHVAVAADIDVTGRGQAADADAWSAVIATLLDGLLVLPAVAPDTSAASPPASEPPSPRAPEPELRQPQAATAWTPPATPASTRLTQRRMIAAVAGIVLLVLVRRRGRRK